MWWVKMILWGQEQALPEHAKKFKVFLKHYVAEQKCEHLLAQKSFVYDTASDEFLESDIQEFYKLWSFC